MRASGLTIARAGRWDTVRVVAEVAAPLFAQGAVLRRPRVVSLVQRCDLEGRAGRLLRRLRDRYDGGPILLRTPGRRFAFLLAAEDVDRVLAQTPERFSAATPEKAAALAHFQPDGVLISPGFLRGPRRAFNERALDTGQAMHRLAGSMVTTIRDEAARLLAGDPIVDWPAFARAHDRLVRRIVLGDAAAEDHVLTALLDSLRRDANWSWLRRPDRATRERFAKRLSHHLQRAEPGSLAEAVAAGSADPQVNPYGQAPHWLFAFDAVGATVMRTLAVLSADPWALGRAHDQLRGLDLARPHALPYLRACVQETLRLWPTTLAILRDSTTPTDWRGRTMPAGTSVVIVSSYFHRDSSRLSYADTFAPDIWLDGRAADEPGLVPFSAGPVRCAGEDLVLFTATTLLAALLERHYPTAIGSRLDRARLPHTLNHARLAVAFAPRSDGGEASRGARGPTEHEPDFADEHKSMTLAFEMAGGPEGRREEGSPRGLAGAD
jgi:cytochrome P450